MGQITNMNERLPEGIVAEDAEMMSDVEVEAPSPTLLLDAEKVLTNCDVDPTAAAAKRKELQMKRLGYNPAAPVAPEYILKRIQEFLEGDEIYIRQKHRFLTMIFKYWSLKRAARRGAPLLKRLHLEV